MGLVFWKDYSPGATEKEAMQRRSREPGRQVAEKQLALEQQPADGCEGVRPSFLLDQLL